MLAQPVEGLAELVRAQTRVAAGTSLGDVEAPRRRLVVVPLDLGSFVAHHRQKRGPRHVTGVEILVLQEQGPPGDAVACRDRRLVVHDVVPRPRSGVGGAPLARRIGRAGANQGHVEPAGDARRQGPHRGDVAQIVRPQQGQGADEGRRIQSRLGVGRRREDLPCDEAERPRGSEQARQNPCAAPSSSIRHEVFHVRREGPVFKVKETTETWGGGPFTKL